MEIAKARTLSERELVEELASARRHLYDLRFQLATRQLTDYSQIAQTRRDIARLLTVKTERGLGDQPADRQLPITARARGKR
jgi:large subunit ribosomal protein L29